MDWKDVEIGKKVIEKETKKIYTIIGIGEGFFVLGDEYILGIPGGWGNYVIKKATEFNLKKYNFSL